MKYIDVTRLLEWSGRYTGMERFAFEITKALEGADSYRLCVYLREKGFVDVSDTVEFQDGRLISRLVRPQRSLRALLREDRRIFLRHYIGRKRLAYQQRGLRPISFSQSDTLIIYDGLWDRVDYVQAIEKATDKGVVLAHVIHDMVPLVMPQVCFDYVTDAFKSYFDQIAPRIDVLFSISKNTQNDFNRIYGGVAKTDLKRIIIRHGEDFGSGTMEKPDLATSITAGDYLLSVGTVEIRKNHQLLYQAYRLAYMRGIELPPIVIVGREGWLAEGVSQLMRKDTAVAGKFIFAGPVSDNELNWLYGHARFTVFPALYEGWGLPVAESLYHKKVCAASSSSSVPEIGGNLNRYYSPYDAGECLQVIQDLLNDDVLQKLERKIAKEYKPTLWSETAHTIAANV